MTATTLPQRRTTRSCSLSLLGVLQSSLQAPIEYQSLPLGLVFGSEKIGPRFSVASRQIVDGVLLEDRPSVGVGIRDKHFVVDRRGPQP